MEYTIIKTQPHTAERKAAVMEAIGILLNEGETAAVDKLKAAVGIPEMIVSYSKSALSGYDYAAIDAKCTPEAGYFRVYDKADVKINMRPYEMVQD